MLQREFIQTYLFDMVYGKKKGSVASVLLFLLHLLSLLYIAAVKTSLFLYRSGIFPVKRLDCKVISLGNITVGGTGKTPTAQALARAIHEAGYKVVILNRGYRAHWEGTVGLVSDGSKIYMTSAEAGDEAYLLAKNLPGVPVVIGRDRYKTGQFACEKLGAEVVILDDGYQHWRLHRDVDILLVDSSNTFGNHYVLPRGILREPLAHLNRAHAFLLTKADQARLDGKDKLREILSKHNPQATISESIHSPCSFQEISDWYKDGQHQPISLETVKGKRILAFSAIGNPGSFEQTLTMLEVDKIDTMRYPDHHSYTMAEMQCIMQKAVDCGVEVIVTTEKDAVKVPPEFIHSSTRLPVWVLGIEVKVTAGWWQLTRLLNKQGTEMRG